MSSVSEFSFGARLSNAQKLHDIAKTFSTFVPPNEQDSLINYLALLKSADNANQQVVVAIDNHNVSTTNRNNAFRYNEHSVIKLLSPIRRAVIAQYGQNSREAIQISNLVKQLRTSKPAMRVSNNGDEQMVSQSEQSFGSLLQSFKNIITTLKNFNDFNPNRVELKLDTLMTFADSLVGINQNVNTTLAVLREKRQQRNDIYEDLVNRTQRIKAYIVAQYGFNSMEHKSTRALKV